MLSCAVDSTVYRTSRPERHSIVLWSGVGYQQRYLVRYTLSGYNEGAKIETGGSDEEEEEEEERKRGELVSFVFGISVFFSLLSEI